MNISNEQKQDELKRIYKEVECIYKHLEGLEVLRNQRRKTQ